MTTEGDNVSDDVFKIPARRSSRVLDKKFHCQYCTDKFAMLIYLKCHEYIHMIDRSLRKDVAKRNKAQKTATTNSEKSDVMTLQPIASVVIDQQSFECYLCHKNFPTLIHLEDHIKMHVVKTFYCDVCDLSFARKSAAAAHQVMHSTRQRWHCSQCERYFFFEGRLQSHERVHQWIDSQPFDHDATIDDAQDVHSDLVSVINEGNASNHMNSRDDVNIRDTDVPMMNPFEFLLPTNFNAAATKKHGEVMVDPFLRPKSQNEQAAGLATNHQCRTSAPPMIRRPVIDSNRDIFHIRSDLVSIINANDVEMRDDTVRNFDVTYTSPKSARTDVHNNKQSKHPRGFQPMHTSTPKKKKIPRRFSVWN